jgi:HEPN domain-containing protein
VLRGSASRGKGNQGCDDPPWGALSVHSDLAALLQLLRGSGLTIPDEVAEANQLSRYAVLTRYPGDDRVDESDYRAALNTAEAVVQWAEGEVGR